MANITLVGFDKNWVQSDTKNRIAKYTNLPSGKYKFMVKVSNNDGLWCENPLAIKIRIGYPLWLKWWAIIAELLLVIGFVTLIVKLRVRNINQQKIILEQEVANRTEELLTQNEEIIAQHDVLNKQKEHIHKIHNQLTDSLEYAKFLQGSFFLTDQQRNSILGENFLVFLPKEKLGGDFFWATIIENSIALAIVDCTGHGVPGALMSMVGVTLVRDIILSPIGTKPNEVLNELHERVAATLSVHNKESTMLNAMDVGYCILNRDKGVIQYSGAHINLYISRGKNGKRVLEEYKSDKKRIGNLLQNTSFNLVETKIYKDDFIYMFTDGIIDQYSLDKKEKITKKRVIKLIEEISDFPTEVQKELILSTIYEWKGSTDQTDDITILAIKV